MKSALVDLYLDLLSGEGLEPTLDADGDIIFESDGMTYLIFVDEEDDTFFRLVFPNFWAIESPEERLLVLKAAEVATSQTKVAKVFTVDDHVWASVEIFLVDPRQFVYLFERCLNALRASAQTFISSMREKTLN